MRSGRNILIVDDEPDVIKLLQLRLEAAGYKVQSALNGLEALESVNRSRPDLIVLDILMPEMDGTEFSQKLKLDKRWSEIPIIFLTALQTKDRQGKDGRVSYDPRSRVFAKPFDSAALLDAIDELLSMA